MKLEESLTKENFWNEMQEKYPNAMKVFGDWIDEYKKEVKWSNLFWDRIINTNGVLEMKCIKFHDLPHAMQLGIWISFIQNVDCLYTIDVNTDITSFKYELKDDIENWMRLAEEDFKVTEDV